MSQAKPFFGISPLILGMSRENVRSLVGTPDTIESTELSAGEPDETWFYRSTQLSLSFTGRNDWRLSSITTESPRVTISGVALVGSDVNSLVEVLAQVGISDLTLTDDFNEFGQCWQSEGSGLMLWAIEGRVNRATVFPEYDVTGEVPLWPG